MFSYIAAMSESTGLKNRIIGAAAMKGRADARMWVETHIWSLTAREEWMDAWEYAESSKTVNVNPDTGARTDVISDEWIMTAVTAVLDAQEAEANQSVTT